MRIGNIELTSPFLAAPLAGVTDAPTRSLASEMGAALTFSEMVSGKGLMYENKNTEDLLYIRPEEYTMRRGDDGSVRELPETEGGNTCKLPEDGGRPVSNVGYQIFGREPDVMEWTAARLAGRDNIIIDINMGCPVPKIVKNGEGSALMNEPELAGEIVRAVVRGANAGANAGAAKQSAHDETWSAEKENSVMAKPVTVKMRAGWDDDHKNAVEVALACEEAGASAVTVHGRTRNQYYSGKADRDIIHQVKKALTIPVIGNGDIFSAEDAVRMMDETGCDGVMIARGSLGNPWIFREAKALWEGKPIPERPQLDEIYEMMRRHFEMLTEDKGERRSVFEMRKHIGWYMKGQPHAVQLRRRVNTITTAAELLEVLEERP